MRRRGRCQPVLSRGGVINRDATSMSVRAASGFLGGTGTRDSRLLRSLRRRRTFPCPGFADAKAGRLEQRQTGCQGQNAGTPEQRERLRRGVGKRRYASGYPPRPGKTTASRSRPLTPWQRRCALRPSGFSCLVRLSNADDSVSLGGWSFYSGRRDMRAAVALLAMVMSVTTGGPLRCPCRVAALLHTSTCPAKAEPRAASPEKHRCHCQTHRGQPESKPKEPNRTPQPPCEHSTAVDVISPTAAERVAGDEEPEVTGGFSPWSSTFAHITLPPLTLAARVPIPRFASRTLLQLAHALRC